MDRAPPALVSLCGVCLHLPSWGWSSPGRTVFQSVLNEWTNEWIFTEWGGEGHLFTRPGGGCDGHGCLPSGFVRWWLLVTFLLVQNFLNGLSKWTLSCFSLSEEFSLPTLWRCGYNPTIPVRKQETGHFHPSTRWPLQSEHDFGLDSKPQLGDWGQAFSSLSSYFHIYKMGIVIFTIQSC